MKRNWMFQSMRLMIAYEIKKLQDELVKKIADILCGLKDKKVNVIFVCGGKGMMCTGTVKHVSYVEEKPENSTVTFYPSVQEGSIFITTIQEIELVS